jgi:hypothetical protein
MAGGASQALSLSVMGIISDEMSVNNPLVALVRMI